MLMSAVDLDKAPQISGLADPQRPMGMVKSERSEHEEKEMDNLLLLPVGSASDLNAADPSLRCELCGKTFQSAKNKTAHVRNLHEGVSPSTDRLEVRQLDS